MEPVTELTVAGQKLAGRLSFHLAMLLASALLPGVVVLTELALLGAHYTRHGGDDFGFLADGLARTQGAGIVVLAAIGVAGGFVLGYLARELGFWAIGLVERTRRATTAGKPRRAASDWSHLQGLLGGDVAEDCRRMHPIIERLTSEQADAEASAGPRRPRAGGHDLNAEFEVLAYSKLWLRRFTPALTIDFTEFEINVLVSTLVPMVLLAVDVVVLGDTMTLVRILALPVAAGVCWAVATSVLRLRICERWEALRNLAFDAAMRTAEKALRADADQESC